MEFFATQKLQYLVLLIDLEIYTVIPEKHKQFFAV